MHTRSYRPTEFILEITWRGYWEKPKIE